MTIYKRTHTLQVEVTRYRPPSSRESLEHSAHPIVILIFFNIIPLVVWLLPTRRHYRKKTIFRRPRIFSAATACSHRKCRYFRRFLWVVKNFTLFSSVNLQMAKIELFSAVFPNGQQKLLTFDEFSSSGCRNYLGHRK
jgi:hypothetical protein